MRSSGAFESTKFLNSKELKAAVIVLFVSFYGTTLAMSYLYAVDLAPIAF